MPSSDIVTTSVAITTKEIIELKSCAKTEECNEIFLGDIQKAYFAHSAVCFEVLIQTVNLVIM